MTQTIIVYDHHTHPVWADLYKRRHVTNNRTNGAYTYSENIVKYHIPVMMPLLKQSQYKYVLITTVADVQPSIVPVETDLIICYLHEFVERELPRVLKAREWYKSKVIYITSRDDLHTKLTQNGFFSILLPMSIEVSEFVEYDTSNKYEDKRVIYFGNRYLGKGGSYEIVKQAFLDNGWVFDSICFNLFNDDSKKLTRQEIFDTIARYKYGIGEGRCVLEMNALGVKTLICASKNQGIMTCDADFEKQKQHNFADGKVSTFSQDITTCIKNFDKAIVRTIDVADVLPILTEKLEGILCKKY